MRFFIKTIILTTLIPSFLGASLAQENYITLLKKYDCLPDKTRFAEMSSHAWHHHATNLETLNTHKDILPKIGVSNQIKTKNNMGSYWG